jgi:hypothetical protein
LRRIFVACALALAACQGEAEAKNRAEAETMVHATRALREAENPGKAAQLEALRGVACNVEDVCALKTECVAAYELYVKGLLSVQKVKAALAGDAGLEQAKESATLLDSAEKDVEKGRERAEVCAKKEAEISVRYKLR